MTEFVAMSLDQQAAVVTNNGRTVWLSAADRDPFNSCHGCYGRGSSGCIPGQAPCGRHSRKDKRDIIWKEVPHG